jgi:phospholipid transport system substrate-binding protein
MKQQGTKIPLWSRPHWLVLCGLLLVMTTQVQADPGPVEILEEMTERVLENVRQDPGVLGDQLRLRRIADEFILPHVDFQALSRWVLGKYWGQATPGQRQQFMALFREHLLGTYLRSLTDYRDQVIQIQPLGPGQKEGRAVVDMEIEQPGGPPVHALFRMHRVKSTWLIYDVAVEGVSLVATHRSSFAREMRDNGIEGLIMRLETINEGTVD